MSNWKATKLDASNKVFNSSDLANGNLAFEPRMQSIPKLIDRAIVKNDRISLFPNPVAPSTGRFRVSFHNKQLGRYDIQLVDLTGRLLSSKSVTTANYKMVLYRA